MANEDERNWAVTDPFGVLLDESESPCESDRCGDSSQIDS